ncbi:MAG: transcriptional regulator [Parcubacteria group bacterium GW2011_GWC1_51_35]|nr:MAG: transcriptional regulator [Parcubacteria group bacterium GW2011_GWC1_51_35]
MEARAVNGNRGSARLRAAIEKARAANMPAENIERATLRGGGAGNESYEEVSYEVYGPGGTALIIVGMTDNKNRTAAELRHLLGIHDASLASPGSAEWAFVRSGDTWVPKVLTKVNEADQRALELLIDALDEHADVKSIFSNAEKS